MFASSRCKIQINNFNQSQTSLKTSNGFQLKLESLFREMQRQDGLHKVSQALDDLQEKGGFQLNTLGWKDKFKGNVEHDITSCMKIFRESEWKYVVELNILVHEYLIALRKNSSAWKRCKCSKYVDLDSWFSNIETIAQLSVEFHRLIEHSKPSVNQFVTVLLTIAPFLRVYAVYCGNYTGALLGFDQARLKCSEFNILVDKLDRQHAPICLRDLITRPIERVGEYFVLLKHLIRLVPEDHIDHQSVVSATEALLSVIDHIVTAVRDREMEKAIHQLNLDLVGPNREEIHLLRPSRLLLFQANVKMSIDASLDCILFSDILLFVERTPHPPRRVLIELNLLDVYANRLEHDPCSFYIVSVQPTVRRYVCTLTVEAMCSKLYHEICQAISKREKFVVSNMMTDKLVASESIKLLPNSPVVVEKYSPVRRNWAWYWSQLVQTMTLRFKTQEALSAQALSAVPAGQFRIMGSGIVYGLSSVKDAIMKNLEVQERYYRDKMANQNQ